jgi:hypothetical protein
MVGEFRSGPAVGVSPVPGCTFLSKTLAYADVDGVAMFEGDIVLGDVAALQAAADPNQPNATFEMASVVIPAVLNGQNMRWVNGQVPFEFEANFPSPQRVNDAIAHWQANTNIRFIARNAGNANQFPDFVRFVNGGGCSSSVGRRGGQQTITLGPNCQTGNAIHEIGHTVGLWHEQSREDRGSFVNIIFANIDPAMQHNFVQQIADGDDVGPYDFGSIMHYPRNAFSINGQDTIVPINPLPPGVVMGQRNGLSAGDIAAVNQMYSGVIGTLKEVAKEPLRDTVKEIAKEPSRDTIKEIRKDPIADTIKEVRKDPIQDTVKEIRKDPILDQTTIKEVGRDPIGPIGPGGTLVEGIGIPGRFQPGLGGNFGFDAAGGEVPFILAGPSRAANAYNQDAVNAEAQVQELGEALGVIDQQYQEIAAAYEQAVQLLAALQGQ